MTDVPDDLDAISAELAVADQATSLNKVEHAFVRTMNIVCGLLARHSGDAAIKRIMEEFDCSAHKARQLIAKADDFLASGLFTNADAARELYAARLQRIHDLCMGRAQEDQVEVTVKPTRVIDEGGKFRMVNGQHVKTKVNVLNTGAVALALQAAEKAAKIAGIVVDSPTSVNNFNVQINNLPGAARTSELANQDLCQLAGFEYAGQSEPDERVVDER